MTFRKKISQFGKVLAKLRRRKKLSQRKLANISGVSSSFIAGIEAGYSSPPSREITQKLAKALGVSPDEFPEEKTDSIMSFTLISREYPNVANLLKRIISRMTDRQLKKTIGRLEKRLATFNEDPEKVADNFIKVLTSKDGLNVEPEFGTRPVDHYLAKWSDDFENWTNPEEVYNDL